MTDIIEKSIIIHAPVERVWRALTDHKEFGTWFRVALDGPFALGEATTGRMTYPGHEGAPWRSVTTRLDEPHLFAFDWPHPDDDGSDGVAAPTTRVEFRLEAIPEGVRLTVVESGFEALPPERRPDIMRGNAEGWSIQTGNVKAYVER